MTDAKLIRVLETQERIHDERERIIAKSNRLAGRARADLTLSELRLLSYLLSKVRPDDKPDTDYTISIRDFLRVCGLSVRSGQNYDSVKAQINSLWSKHFWVRDDEGRETGVQWILRPVIDRAAGTVSMRLDPSVQEYVLDLIRGGWYYQFHLLAILPMRSVYSIRLYEFLKSGAYRKKKLLVDMDDLRRVLQCVDIYPNFKDLRRRVLDTAVSEINDYTDLFAAYAPINNGRKCVGVEFTIRQRNAQSVYEIFEANHAMLDAQMTIADYL